MPKAKTLFLGRLQDCGKQTIGGMVLFNGLSQIFYCTTIEPPWKDNQHSISCIPTGVYTVTPCNSPKHGACFLVLDVPGRSAIEIHAGNFVQNTEGCLLVGRDLTSDMNGDGLMDLNYSQGALKTLVQFIQEPCKLHVVNLF